MTNLVSHANFEREINRVTPAGLQSQSLSRILECEKPEIEKQRNDILKLQGEQNVKLRELEEQMLREISAVEGNILDNDRVVEGMERLMKEGAQVEEQIANSAKIMSEVQGAIVSVQNGVCAVRTNFRCLTLCLLLIPTGCI